MTIIDCPKCRKKTSNLENCEHCGSLFVRYFSKNIFDQRVNDSFLFEDDSSIVQYSFKGMEDYLKNIINDQKSFINKFGPFTKGIFLTACISSKYQNEDEYLFLIGNITEDILMCFHDSNNSLSNNRLMQSGLVINIVFLPNDDNNKLEKFRSLNTYKLFQDKSPSHEYHSFLLNCAEDSRGAAYVATQILKEVYNLTSDEITYSKWNSSPLSN
jgi:hypothetical protein